MGRKRIQAMDKYTSGIPSLVQTSERLHRSMEVRQQRRKGNLVLNKLEKATKHAEYWRNKYDDLLHHLEHQNQYRKYLERKVFGGSTF